MATQIINRYSETDLAEFKAAIDKKVEKAERQLASLEEQLTNVAESKGGGGDWIDDSSSNSDIEMLEVMSNRQKKYLIELKNALQRINNKSYGICAITGELIDKRRLMAVLTTTKSLAAKVGTGQTPIKRVFRPEAKPKASSAPKIFSRIISKPASTPKPKVWEDDEDLDIELEDELGLGGTEIDLDNYSEEDMD